MNPLGHAEAHERLADLALEPGALDALGSPGGDPLAAHVATCEACTGEVRSWSQTHARLIEARGSGEDALDLAGLAGDDSVAAPASLRRAVLRAVRAQPISNASLEPTAAVFETLGPPRDIARRAIARRLVPLVAVLGIVALGAGLVVDQALRLDQARQETAALGALSATLDRILRDPEHRVADLHTADGTVQGSVSWSRHDIAIVTMALEPPPPDRIYRCWIERGGVRSPIGLMWFAGDAAFWNGSLDEWATTSLEAGGTFGISLEPVSAPAGNPAVLAADLGG